MTFFYACIFVFVWIAAYEADKYRVYGDWSKEFWEEANKNTYLRMVEEHRAALPVATKKLREALENNQADTSAEQQNCVTHLSILIADEKYTTFDDNYEIRAKFKAACKAATKAVSEEMRDFEKSSRRK